MKFNPKQRSRGWCFTINNWKSIEFVKICQSKYTYLVMGLEKGKKGTSHLQGYIYYSNAHRGSTIKELMPRAHIEAAKGSHEQNRKYCTKDGLYFEFGTIPQQGKRSDLDDIRDMINNKVPMQQIAQQHFGSFIRYSKGIERYQSLMFTERTTKPKVIWVYGPTGSGKTRYATSISSSFYIKDHTQWWDGYQQQDVIVIDDFDGRWPFRDLLRLLDRYPYRGQYKGGYIAINSPYIVITCDRSIDECMCQLDDGELSQLKRRIDKFKYLNY